MTDKDLWWIDSRFYTIRDRVRDLFPTHRSNDLASRFVQASIESALRHKSLFKFWHPAVWHSGAMEFAELGDVLITVQNKEIS